MNNNEDIKLNPIKDSENNNENGSLIGMIILLTSLCGIIILLFLIRIVVYIKNKGNQNQQKEKENEELIPNMYQ